MSQHFQAVRLARAQRCRHMQTTGVCIDFLKLQNLQLLVLAATPVAAGHTRNPQLCDERTRNSLQVCLAWFRACLRLTSIGQVVSRAVQSSEHLSNRFRAQFIGDYSPFKSKGNAFWGWKSSCRDHGHLCMHMYAPWITEVFEKRHLVAERIKLFSVRYRANIGIFVLLVTPGRFKIRHRQGPADANPEHDAMRWGQRILRLQASPTCTLFQSIVKMTNCKHWMMWWCDRGSPRW